MEDRYPYLRFVTGAAQIIAAAVGIVILLGGLMRGCHIGGFSGLWAFVFSALVAAIAWIAAMTWVESLQVFLDIEENTRRLADRQPPAGSAVPPPPAA